MSEERQILQLPLARAVVDRASHLRSDEAELEKLWGRARILHFASGKFRVQTHHRERPMEADGTAQHPHLAQCLDLLDADQVAALIKSTQFTVGERFFLGLDGYQPYFAWCGDAVDIDQFQQYATLRELGGDLSDLEIGLAVHAQALANWHHKHPRCSVCGEITKSVYGGSVRRCVSDATEHYPRNDPAISVLIKDQRDRILLGRQKVWPQFRFSTFAGFVEPGESFEQCVVREVAEEAGVQVEEIRYLGSQPWPFPASLMIAFEAVATNPESARPDGEEIEEVLWLTRSELKDAIRRNTLLLPPKISVARRMIEAWYGPDAKRDLSGGEVWRS
jgi:NAD+ diphosphatase